MAKYGWHQKINTKCLFGCFLPDGAYESSSPSDYFIPLVLDALSSSPFVGPVGPVGTVNRFFLCCSVFYLVVVSFFLIVTPKIGEDSHFG